MITSLLTRHFGFDRLRPGQEAVISRLLAGKSAAASSRLARGNPSVINCPPSHCPT